MLNHQPSVILSSCCSSASYAGNSGGLTQEGSSEPWESKKERNPAGSYLRSVERTLSLTRNDAWKTSVGRKVRFPSTCRRTNTQCRRKRHKDGGDKYWCEASG